MASTYAAVACLLSLASLAGCSLEIHEAASPRQDSATPTDELPGDDADAETADGDSGGDADADAADDPGITCPPDLTPCGTVCVDTRTHPDHCGDCFFVCGERGNCVGGQCECTRDLVRCPEGCISVLRDPLNCGDCGNVCPEGTRCRDGTCG